MKKLVPVICLLLAVFVHSYGQDSTGVSMTDFNKESFTHAGGFVRAGFYLWTDKSNHELYIPTAFSDLALKIETGNGTWLRVYADFRYRYGSEYQTPVSRPDLREAWIGYATKKLTFSAGRKIIKYGRCDFTNPTSRMTPTDMLSRSPDREDMDLANLLFSTHYFPSEKIDIEFVAIPFYRPSVLIIEPIKMPSFITLNRLPGLLAGNDMSSYSLKADFHFRKIDWGISWFDGYDPMPGIALDKFNADLGNPVPLISVILSFTPYKNRVAGLDFETSAGVTGIRGEAAYSFPNLPFRATEYVPMPEIKWALGADRTAGIWHFTAEYDGKYVTDFIQSEAEPLIGSNIDISQIAELLLNPEIDIKDYVTQQIIAFNRLYNNQIKNSYHSAALKVEAELGFSRYMPSLLAMYNITSGDLLVIPEVRIRSLDGFTITAGAEIYSGKKGSLYDLVDDFMNGAYMSVRFDF
jgi:hypothetical protein